jgi:hypothetical protein
VLVVVELSVLQSDSSSSDDLPVRQEELGSESGLERAQHCSCGAIQLCGRRQRRRRRGAIRTGKFVVKVVDGETILNDDLVYFVLFTVRPRFLFREGVRSQLLDENVHINVSVAPDANSDKLGRVPR